MRGARERRRHPQRGGADYPDRARLRHGGHPGGRRARQAHADPDGARGARAAHLRPALEPVDDVGSGAAADGDVLSGWIDIGPASELGEAVPFAAEVDGVPVVVVRCGKELYAVEDRCTHEGESFAGAEAQSCELICPRHGSRSDLRTGDPLPPPAYEPVRTYAVREHDGRILVEQP